MVSLHEPAPAPPLAALATPRLLVRPAEPADAARLARYVRVNAAHHAPWDPPRPPDYHLESHWRRRLRAQLDDTVAGRSFMWLWTARHDPDGPTVGTCRFSNVQRGPAQSCSLGYGGAAAHEGQGYMTEALGAIIDYAFAHLGLHRIHANYVPSNERSARLLRRLEFQVEGYATRYLFVGGEWRDHVLTAKVNPRGVPPG